MATFEDLAALFGDRPFLRRTALEHGFTRGVLRNPALHSRASGVRQLGAPDPSLRGRALQLVPILRPGDRFSHATALALLGCPIRVPVATPVDIERPRAGGEIRRRGVRGHRRTEAEAPPYYAPGDARIPVVPPLQALLQAAGQLPFQELVVACDHLVRQPRWGNRPPVITLDGLREFAARARGRHVRRLRAAAALARVGADSRMETLTRLRAERAGLRTLELQVGILSRTGELIGYFDLVERETRSIYEFDGEQHRLDREQYLRDIQRLDLVRFNDWRVLRIHREDILDERRDPGGAMLRFAGSTPILHPPEIRRLLDERWELPPFSQRRTTSA